MNKYVVTVGLLGAAILLIIWVRNNVTLNGVKLADYWKVDARAREMADAYMKHAVGEKEFSENYQYDPTLSEKCTQGGHPIGCYVVYEFLPGKIYSKSSYSIFYSSYSGTPKVELVNNDVPISLPSCERDENRCTFKLTREELNSIADRYILSGKYRRTRMVMYGNKIVVEVSYCDLNTTANRKKIKVDPISGQVVWEGDNEECKGII